MDLTSALFHRVKKLPLNHSGRDFLCGDLHGEIGLLEALLAHVNFDPLNDRLIASGDLIDRGKSSLDCLQLLTKPWFHSIVGNHEQLLLSCNPADVSSQTRWFSNGGQWWLNLTAKQQTNARQLLLDHLSLAIEIELPERTVGVIHADFPPDVPWQAVHSEPFQQDSKQLMHCLWSRTRHKSDEEHPIIGIDYLVTGHTPLPQVIKSENVICIDTGCGYHPSGRLPHPALTFITFEAQQILVYSSNRYFGVKQMDSISLE